jgi:hypothetical protein
MPIKLLTSPFDNKGNFKMYKFGGGSNDIVAQNHDGLVGYHIRSGGGDDTITGADFADMDLLTNSDDTLIGGDGSDTVIGGLGDDMIFGGNEDGSDGAKGKGNLPSNGLFGDGHFVNLGGGSYTGGNDVIRGGDDGFNMMVGDVQSASNGTFQGGDDRLISGTNANDTMVGDFGSGDGALTGGSDTFVFAANNGFDQIVDFEIGKDTVELTGFASLNAFADLAGMWTTSFGLGTVLALDLDGTVDGMGDIIAFSGFGIGDEILFENDFVFT